MNPLSGDEIVAVSDHMAASPISAISAATAINDSSHSDSSHNDTFHNDTVPNGTTHDDTTHNTTTLNDTPIISDSSQPFDTSELLRQVEYYFSDENLERDAHALGKLEEGNGTISISHVTGWRRMRKFRPLGAVKAALKESTVIEIINNKRIRRLVPFDMSKAKVKPCINEEERNQHQAATLKAKPWLSKGMLKRTGFEHDYVEPNLTNEEQQTELEQYSIELPIYDRLQEAVLRYKMNRKFHQETLSLFHAFLNYGGFDERPSGFTGGTSKEDEEGLSKEEKAMRKQVNYVSKDVIQSLEEADGKWIVDFEGVTKGFFSTPFPVHFLWHDDFEHDKEVTQAACNVLRNFFNYLLYHNVCAEYTNQIIAAIDALKLVEIEYAKLAQVQVNFPGAFSIACSTLLDGHYFKIGYRGTWMDSEEVAEPKTGFSSDEARSIVNAGIAAFETETEMNTALDAQHIHVVDVEEEVGFEVTGIMLSAETSQWAQAFFDKLKGTVVAPLGKLFCNRIHFENAAPLDYPANYEAGLQSFEFLVDDETLQKCFTGMKFVATIHQINSDFWFIDHWSECNGTFYTWCWNERAREFKEYADPFKLAKSKQSMQEAPVVLVSKDRMLEDHAYSEEQATEIERNDCVNMQALQIQGSGESEEAKGNLVVGDMGHLYIYAGGIECT
ncbi:hypothetical protein Q7P35_000549 [Cladosporium inversicolor]